MIFIPSEISVKLFLHLFVFADYFEWNEEAKQFVEKLTLAKMLQAQVHGYAEDGVPFVHLYSVEGSQVSIYSLTLVPAGHSVDRRHGESYLVLLNPILFINFGCGQYRS